MRLLSFNIAYGTGGPRNMRQNLLTAGRYLRTPDRNIEKISRFLRAYSPDIAALLEVDTGSFRTRYCDQAALLANRLDSGYCSEIKYRTESLGRRIPILRRQGNAVLAKEEHLDVHCHYLPIGFKRLVIELKLKGLNVYAAHLALLGKTRKKQFESLKSLIEPGVPCIVTGDFNTLSGEDELSAFLADSGLRSANTFHAPTFPAWKPEKQLDFVLYSEGIRPLDFFIPQVRCSDHLPLLFDFELISAHPSSEKDSGSSRALI